MSGELTAIPQDPILQAQTLLAQGVDPKSLSEMLAVSERFKAVEEKRRFVETIANFQAICPVIKKNLEVTKKDGTHLYNHTNYENIKKIIGPYLKQFNIVTSFSFDDLGDGRMLGHITISVGAHKETSSMPIRVPKLLNTNEAQDHGGATHYLKRYLLVAALDLTIEDEDKDGRDLGEALSPEQVKTLKKRIEDCEQAGHPIDMEKFLATYEAARLEDINPKLYKDVLNMIGKKLAKAAGHGRSDL